MIVGLLAIVAGQAPPQMHVLYDVSTRSFRGWELAVGGLIVALLSLVVPRPSPGASLARRAIRPTLAILGAGWALFIGAGLWGAHVRLRRAVAAGQFNVVAGIVYDHPGGAGGEDHWLVDTPNGAHWYPYQGSRMATGYVRRTPGSGGIRTGDRVRIADVNGRIARIELVVR